MPLTVTGVRARFVSGVVELMAVAARAMVADSTEPNPFIVVA